jgi:PAS domain S-box-containing protein
MTRPATLLTSVAPSDYDALAALDPAVLEAIPAAVYICAADGAIVRFNRRAVELWGRVPEIGDTDERFYGSFHVHDLKGRSLPHARTPMAIALRTGRPQSDKEVVIERPDGSRIVASVQVDTLKDRYGRVQGAISCFQDITARKRTEESLARRMEEQVALYRITDSLHRAQSLADVYDSALDAILRALPCQRASILLFDEAGVMRFVAWRGLSDAYRLAVDGHSPWTPDAKDPQPIWIDDVDSADLAEPLRTTIKAEGIGALAFIPLVTGGKLVGKFMSYYDTAHAFTPAELDLAVAIGRQLGFGVERIRAQQARRMAVQELRESEARERARATELQTIMEAVPAVIWIARDRDCRTISGNTAAYEVLRLSRDSNPSLSAPADERPTHFEVLLDGRVLGPEELPVQRAARGEEVRNFEEEVRFDDGTSRYLLGNATPLRDADGNSCGSVAAFVDITDRKKAEEQRDLLVAELSHRVKNTLAIVISIAQQSFSKNPNAEEACRSFDARIRALAQTHNRLAEANWSGVSLEAMLLDELAPYFREDGRNIRVSGPPIALHAKCALTLGMALHELATNAAKHGALSCECGSVDVTWQVDPRDRQLRIRWSEAGGPPVRPPGRSGFGRLLLERALASDLGGDVQLDFDAAGLKCAVAIPLDEHVARFS